MLFFFFIVKKKTVHSMASEQRYLYKFALLILLALKCPSLIFISQPKFKDTRLIGRIKNAIKIAEERERNKKISPPYYACAFKPKVSGYEKWYCDGPRSGLASRSEDSPFACLEDAEAFLMNKIEPDGQIISRQPEDITIKPIGFWCKITLSNFSLLAWDFTHIFGVWW
jgi:hypothetical protein